MRCSHARSGAPDILIIKLSCFLKERECTSVRVRVSRQGLCQAKNCLYKEEMQMSIRDWLKRRKQEMLRPAPTDEQESFDETMNEGSVDPFNPFPEPIQLEILDVIDLHTVAPRDVKAVVEEYLREAHSAGFRSVRIIHGKGKGVQRQMVRKILARTPFVEEFTDAPPHAGGMGATVARLSMKDV